MKKVLFRLSFFLSPFILAMLIELFVLPIDFFSFRVLEALVTTRAYHFILSGPFYPNMKITKIEKGDLLPHTKSAVEKRSEWETDRYGYRKKNTNNRKYDIVIVGDSNILGSGLTQKDMLSEVLENQLQMNVYPLAPAEMNQFLKNERFINHRPDIVIFGNIERQITSLERVKFKRKSWDGNEYIQYFKSLREVPTIQSIAVVLDRITKANMLHYYRSKLRREVLCIGAKGIPSTEGSMIFLQGVDANREVPDLQLNKTVQVIEQYDRAFKEIGIRFIFLPIPNKENIYYELLPVQRRPVFLERLIDELKKKGIETVDTQRAFEEEYREKSTLLYHLDDTHWNANGVRIAATLIKDMIQKNR